MRAGALTVAMVASAVTCDQPVPCVEAAIHHVRAPGGTRDASIYEGGCGPHLAPQVVIEFETPRGKGGSGVFAVRDRTTRLGVRWLDDATLEIEYPADARIEKRDTLARFYDERVRIVYRIAPPPRAPGDSARGTT